MSGSLGPGDLRVHLTEVLPHLAGLGVSLDPAQEERILAFVQELLRWNRKMNLTRILEPQDIFVSHLLDSLVPARFLRDARCIVDVGAGGGFPGIPLGILRPDARVYLVEGRRRKTAFLRHIRRVVGLENLVVVCGRTEEVAVLGELVAAHADAMVTRAALSPTATIELGDAILQGGGRMVLMRGEMAAGETERLRGACSDRDIAIEQVFPYRLPGLDRDRNLVVMRKGGTGPENRECFT